MVSGASVWPMKMLAATFSDSAPLARMNAVHHDREQPDDELHDAEVVEDREQRGDEDDRRQHLNAKMSAYWPPSGPSTFVMIRGHTSRIAERAEDERRADVGEVEQLRDDDRRALWKTRLPDVGLEHDRARTRPAAPAPRPRSVVDRVPGGRQAVGQRQDEREAGNRLHAAGAREAQPDGHGRDRGQRRRVASASSCVHGSREPSPVVPCSSSHLAQHHLPRWRRLVADGDRLAAQRAAPPRAASAAMMQLEHRLAGAAPRRPAWLEHDDARRRDRPRRRPRSRPAPSACDARPTASASIAVTNPRARARAPAARSGADGSSE